MSSDKSRVARKKQQMNNKNKKTKKKSIWKKIFLTLFLLFLAAGIGVGSLVTYWIVTAPKLDKDQIEIPYASQFYTKDGELFADRGAENRIKIKYDDLPESLIQAVIATEDSRFFEHNGIDLKRLGAAIMANIKRGFGAEGASTITHQVAEKMFLSPDKKLKIKVQEQWLAFQLERKYSKEEILEMYLNTIFYGSNAYGVAKASEVYFGKEDLHDLTLIESAMLAGLPQRPTAYNPFESPDLMQGRVDTVLKLMVRHGMITQEEADEAREIDVSSVLTEKKPKSFPYDAFLQKAEKELEEKLGDVDIQSDGLKVYTTLDTHAQEYVEFLLTDSAENPIPYGGSDMLAGMTVVDTKTGAVRAIGGSRNRETAFGSNFAIEANRQPGSTMKPIAAYAPAIEYEQWSTYEQIKDEPYNPYGSHEIRNVDRQHRGWISMREALRISLNVPAAKTLVEIGSDRVKEFGEKLGIPYEEDTLGPYEAIGGTGTNVSPLQLAGAYAAFGNEGVYTEPYTVTKVEFPDGSTIDLKPESEAVMNDYTAYMVTDMLKDAVSSGTGTNANIPHLPIAGKTGTTNIQGESGANNSWFVGYSSNYSIAVWTGHKNNNQALENTQVPHALFKYTMTELSKNIDTADFEKPDSVVEYNIVKGSNPPAIAPSASDSTTRELFVKGNEPNTTIKEEKVTIDPVSNLVATYNEDNDAIDISWDYSSDKDVSFEVAFKVDGGSYKELTTTNDLNATIDQVDNDASYTIQVIAVDNDSGEKSDPQTATVEIGEEEVDIGSIENLTATYEDGVINISWGYNGDDPAKYEVNISGPNNDTGSTDNTSYQFSTSDPGEYTITVTPYIDDDQGDAASTTVTIEEEEPEEEPEEPDQNDDNEDNQEEPDPEDEDVNGDQDNNNDDNDDEEDQS